MFLAVLILLICFTVGLVVGILNTQHDKKVLKKIIKNQEAQILQRDKIIKDTDKIILMQRQLHQQLVNEINDYKDYLRR